VPSCRYVILARAYRKKGSIYVLCGLINLRITLYLTSGGPLLNLKVDDFYRMFIKCPQVIFNSNTKDSNRR